MLKGMLGFEHLVDAWWTGANKAFEDKTPKEVYDEDEEGKIRVSGYIAWHYGGK